MNEYGFLAKFTARPGKRDDLADHAEARHRQAQQDQPGRHYERAGGQRLASPPPHEPGGVQRGRDVAQGEHGEDLSRGQGGEPQALLEVEREHQEERGHARVEHQRGQQADREGPRTEQRQVKQRGAVARGQAPLGQAEGQQQGRGGGQGQPGPERPPQPRPRDQRQHDGHESQRDEGGAQDVEPPAALAPRGRQHPCGIARRADHGGCSSF